MRGVESCVAMCSLTDHSAAKERSGGFVGAIGSDALELGLE